jgi:hypothetical protein
MCEAKSQRVPQGKLILGLIGSQRVLGLPVFPGEDSFRTLFLLLSQCFTSI